MVGIDLWEVDVTGLRSCPVAGANTESVNSEIV
jgi:hypothetical protein